MAVTQDLSELGVASVKFYHYRMWGSSHLDVEIVPMPKHDIKALGIPVYPRGGETWVELYDSNGELLAKAGAKCSLADNYCKKIGRAIALGRATKELAGQRANGS